MGWDAYAEPVRRLWRHKEGRDGLADLVHDAAFAAAEKRVRDKVGTVDGLLRQAGLDVSDCAHVLQEATGANTYPDGERTSKWDWSPDDVKRYNEFASLGWDNILDSGDYEPWAVWSSREFLETCARLGLGVRFSW